METPTSEYILHYDRGLIVVHDYNAKSFLTKTQVNAFYHGRAAALAQRAVVLVTVLS